jgi:chromosome segregation ATPase
MSEEEQAINVSEWKELHADLEEVSDKRNRLQTENNRLKALIQLTQKECDEAKNELRDMTAQRDHAKAQWEECCEDRSRLNGSANRIVQQLQTERDHAKAQLKECCEDRSRQVTALREQVVEMTASRDNFERLCKEWRIEFDTLSAKKDGLQVQLSQWQAGHDFIKEQLAQAKESADTFEAENTSLRDTIQKLRAKQVHDDLPGILCAIQLAAEQARELI